MIQGTGESFGADLECGPHFGYLVVRESALENAVIENLRTAPEFRYLPGFAGRWSISVEQANALHQLGETSTDPETYQAQRDAVAKVMNWMQSNPNKDFEKAFSLGAGKIGLSSDAFYGAFSNSPLTSRAAMQQAAIRRQIPFLPLSLRWPHGIPDSERPLVQQIAVQQIVQWMKENPGKPLEAANFGTGPGKVGMGQDQLYATGHFREGAGRHGLRYFDSMAAALSAVKIAAHSEGLAFNLLDFNWRGGIPPEIRAQIQQEAAQKALDWLKKNPKKKLGKSTFGTADGEVGITQDQFYGTSEYRLGRSKHGSRYFDSMETALLQVKQLAMKQNYPFQLRDYVFEGGIPASIRPEIQSEAVAAVLDWLEAHPGEKAVDSNFGRGKIPVTPAQLYGQGDYGPGGVSEPSRYFSDRESAVLAIKAAAELRNIPFRVIDLNWRGGFPASLRPAVEKEVLAAVVDWVRANEGKPLNRPVFGAGPGQLNLDDTRLFATGRYRPGQPDRESRYFDDRKSAQSAMVQAVKAAGLRVPPNFEK